MLWFAGAVNPALKLLLPNQKNVIKNQDMVKISSGGLSLLHSATYSTVYWQAPGKVICQPVPPTGNIKPT